MVLFRTFYIFLHNSLDCVIFDQNFNHFHPATSVILINQCTTLPSFFKISFQKKLKFSFSQINSFNNIYRDRSLDWDVLKKLQTQNCSQWFRKISDNKNTQEPPFKKKKRQTWQKGKKFLMATNITKDFDDQT